VPCGYAAFAAGEVAPRTHHPFVTAPYPVPGRELLPVAAPITYSRREK
jgi:hypothetical protein